MGSGSVCAEGGEGKGGYVASRGTVQRLSASESNVGSFVLPRDFCGGTGRSRFGPPSVY